MDRGYVFWLTLAVAIINLINILITPVIIGTPRKKPKTHFTSGDFYGSLFNFIIFGLALYKLW